MARIRPSFLNFYLFRPRQHNTSFLLTSKDELKYPGGSFPKQPKPFTLSATFSTSPRLSSFSFSIVNEVTLFIYLVNYISPSRTIQDRVHKFFWCLLPNPQILDPSLVGDLHNPVWPLASTSNKISNPF